MKVTYNTFAVRDAPLPQICEEESAGIEGLASIAISDAQRWKVHHHHVKGHLIVANRTSKLLAITYIQHMYHICSKNPSPSSNLQISSPAMSEHLSKVDSAVTPTESKTGTMKALRIHGKEDLRLEDIQTPPCGDGQIMIKPAWCGICGTGK